MARRLKRRVARAVPWMVADSVFIAVSGVAASLIIAWLLGPDEVGRAAIAMSIVNLVAIMTGLGLEEAMVRHPSVHTDVTDTAFVGLFGLAGLGIGACWGAAYVVGHVYDDPELPLLVGMSGFLLLLDAAAGVPMAVLTRKMRAKVITRRLMMGKLTLLAVTGGLAYAGFGAWSIIGGQFCANCVSVAALWSGMRRWPRLRFDAREFRSLIAFGSSITAQKLIRVGTTRLFGLLLGYFHGVAALGHFQFSQRLVEQLANLIQGNIIRYGLSFFAQLERSSRDPARPFLVGTSLLTALGAPVFIGLALVAPDLVPLLFGQKWAPAVPVVQIFACVWFLMLSRSLVGPLMRAKGHQNEQLVSGLVASLVSLGSTLLTVAHSLTVVVLGWALRAVIIIPWGLYLANRFGGIPFWLQLGAWVRPLAPTTAMAVLVLLAQYLLADASAPLRLGVSIAVGVLGYAAFLPLFNRETVRLGLRMIDMFRTARKRA